MENTYHKFVFDHLSEMDPPLFFDPSSHTDSDPPTTPTTSGNALPLARHKRSNDAIHNDGLDIYEVSYEMDWAPWKFDIIINDVNIERVLLDLYERCQRTRPKIKTSLEDGKL